MSKSTPLLLKMKQSVHKCSHKGNALIITISILLLATAQMLFMGLISSSTSTDEGLLLGQNTEVKDVLNLGFIDIENRIKMARDNGATIAQINDEFQLPPPLVTTTGRCVPSYRRDPANLATILPSSAANCPFNRPLDVPFNTLMQSRLAIESVQPGALSTDPTIVAVQPPLDRYTDISVYLAGPIQGSRYILEGRVVGRGVNITIQRRILIN